MLKHLNWNKIKANLICTIAVIFFAFGFPAAEALLLDWGILSILAIRNILAFLIIFLIWFFWEGKVVIKITQVWRGIYIGALGFGIGSSLLVVAQYFTNSVTAALAAAMMPLAGVVLEVLLDNRRLTKWFFFGALSVILGGVVSLGLEILNSQLGIGAIVGFFSATIFAWGSRQTTKGLPDVSYLSQTLITTFGMLLFSVVVLSISSLFESTTSKIPNFKFEYIYLIIVYSCFGLALSQTLWIKAVGELGIGVASFHMNATPFFVMIIVYLMGANWSWSQLGGVTLVVFGIIIAQYRVKNRKNF